jgi:hypothetical protein
VLTTLGLGLREVGLRDCLKEMAMPKELDNDFALGAKTPERVKAEDPRMTRSLLQARAPPFLSRTPEVESRRAVTPRHPQPQRKARLSDCHVFSDATGHLREHGIGVRRTALYSITVSIETSPGIRFSVYSLFLGEETGSAFITLKLPGGSLAGTPQLNDRHSAVAHDVIAGRILRLLRSRWAIEIDVCNSGSCEQRIGQHPIAFTINVRVDAMSPLCFAPAARRRNVVRCCTYPDFAAIVELAHLPNANVMTLGERRAVLVRRCARDRVPPGQLCRACSYPPSCRK